MVAKTVFYAIICLFTSSPETLIFMTELAETHFDYRDSELVLGIVAPTGTDTGEIEKHLEAFLEDFGYRIEPIKLSKPLINFQAKLGLTIDEGSTRYEWISSLMEAGDRLREGAGRGDILALLAIDEISARREFKEESSPTGMTVTIREPRKRVAYLLDSLKHPDEVATLRKVYGSGFFLIGLDETVELRETHLAGPKNLMSDEQIRDLFKRDEHEDRPSRLGQRTRDTYYLSDVFFKASDRTGEPVRNFIELLFGNPFITPTRDEHAMFLAFATSTRSGDLSRQVGAVIFSADRELLAVGVNEVPCYKGGVYDSESEPDWRDMHHKFDPNENQKIKIADDVASRLDLDKKLVREKLKDSLLFDITEFGRAAHAEMEALLSCARKGLSVRGATLFTTTFPCHNCAKHIITAGIDTVVYLEPYPKSKAQELHKDSMKLNADDLENTVNFRPFLGIAARRFMDLFSMRLSTGRELVRKRSDREGVILGFRRSMEEQLRIPMSALSYLQREGDAAVILAEVMSKYSETN